MGCADQAARELAGAIAIALIATAACPAPQGPCASDYDCQGGAICINGSCRTACNSNLDCSRRERCTDGVCIAVDVTDAAADDGATDGGRTYAVADTGPRDRNADAAGRDAYQVDAHRPDAVQSDAIHPLLACGTTSTLQDDFDDGVTSWQWVPYTVQPGTISEQNGQLRIDLGAGTTAGAEASDGSNYATVLRNDVVRVQVVQAASANEVETYLSFGSDPNNWLVLYHLNGILHAEVFVGGSIRSANTATYQATAHRYWQIRENNGHVWFEVSADATSWTSLLDAQSPALVDAGYLTLGAAAYQALGQAQASVFDNFNVGRPRPAWCLASSLQDDFGGAALSPEWQPKSSTGCTIAQNNGRVLFSHSGNGDADCRLWSARVFAFDQVRVEVAQRPTGDSNAAAIMALEVPAGPYVELSLQGDQLYTWIDTDASLVPFAANNASWLRLRRDGATLLYEASSDGRTWSTVRSIGWNAGEGPVYSSLALGCFGCQAGSRQASFDNFNLP